MVEITRSRFTQSQEVFLYVFALCAFQLYSYVGFGKTVCRLLLFAIIPITVFVCRKTVFRTGMPQLFNLMRWLWIVTFFSMFMAWMFRGQSIILGYRPTAVALVFIFFFYLYQTRPPVEKLEALIWVFGFAYVILWLYATTQLPARVFGFKEEMELTDTSRGMERINFVGRLSMIFAYFLAVNKFYDTRKKFFILIAAVLFVFIVLQLTRQLILWTGLVTIYYVWLKSKGTLITIACVLIAIGLAGVSLIKFSDDSVVGSLINISERQAESQASGEDDIRIVEYRYMFTEHNKNVATHLLGSGYAHGDSTYGRSVKRLNETRRIYFTDVGYGDMYAITGLVGLLLYLFLYYKCLRVPLPQHLHYVKMFMLFLVFANITASWYHTADGQIAMSICVYVMLFYRSAGKDVGLLSMFKDCKA